MNAAKRKALEAAGWRFGDAADFLALTDEERQLLDARIEAALAVRRQRHARKLSQAQLAVRIKTSQPRIAKIERADRDVSLDQILRAFAAAGGRIAIRQVEPPRSTKASGKSRSGSRSRRDASQRASATEFHVSLITTNG
jgi:transcriptional regulator with XRE-family HTH domain